jgi:hypothetical protein
MQALSQLSYTPKFLGIALFKLDYINTLLLKSKRPIAWPLSAEPATI